jgi:hypothetical protein
VCDLIQRAVYTITHQDAPHDGYASLQFHHRWTTTWNVHFSPCSSFPSWLDKICEAVTCACGALRLDPDRPRLPNQEEETVREGRSRQPLTATSTHGMAGGKREKFAPVWSPPTGPRLWRVIPTRISPDSLRLMRPRPKESKKRPRRRRARTRARRVSRFGTAEAQRT